MVWIFADMIAIMGETTGIAGMKYMKSRMENNPEGIRILKYAFVEFSLHSFINNVLTPILLFFRDKPRLNSSTVDLERLKLLPDETFGRKYYRFLEVNVSIGISCRMFHNVFCKKSYIFGNISRMLLPIPEIWFDSLTILN